MKKHPSLIPLFLCIGVGTAGAVYYILRLATRNPDVTWNRNTNPLPNQEFANKQYKFYSPIRDYSKIESPAPKF
ncbi:Hypothetical predicted protein [Cloeon dipterum]|uniref:NADH dehydrogenase [ubiquinone] 1 alpha subcomplex subunit 4 n=2 Tax=Cloeon dipterum TaxID=197152 RepID=A0A8S1BYP4_9INSE|nr:Hypothetical predicted protein [Cloeon dipterum]